MKQRSKYRILFLNSSPRIGGGEISLATLLQGLKNTPYKSVTVCPEGTFASYVANLGLDIIPIRIYPLKPFKKQNITGNKKSISIKSCFMNILLLVKNYWQIRNILRKTKPDLIHVNTLKGMTIVFIVKMLSNLPVIWHIRVVPSIKYRTGRFYIRFFSKLSNKVVVISNAVLTRLLDVGVNARRLELVYNPIDTKMFSPKDKTACRQLLNLSEKDIIIGAIGRLYRSKGLEILIRAGAKLKKNFRVLKILIIGSEWQKGYRNELLNLIKQLHMESDVIFLGWQNDIQNYISALDILTLTPLSDEAFGRTLAEAMACEIPVVGSNIDGIKEIIEDKKNGILVQAGNTDQLVDAIKFLLVHRKQAKQYSKEGRKKIVARFSKDRHLKYILKIYQRFL